MSRSARLVFHGHSDVELMSNTVGYAVQAVPLDVEGEAAIHDAPENNLRGDEISSIEAGTKELSSRRKIISSIDGDTIDRVGGINLDLLTEANLDEFLVDSLIRQITYGLPGTNGGYFSNTFAYILTEHDLLSIFFTHPCDPFTRNKRAVYLYLTLVIILVMSQQFNGNYVVFTTVVTTLVLEPVKFMMRRAIECPCIRVDNCIYRWFCSCIRGHDDEEKKAILMRADRYSWALLLLFALGGTGITINVFIMICIHDAEDEELDDDRRAECLDPVSWASSQAFSLLFVSVCGLLLYVKWTFSSHREKFKDKVTDVFGISRAYQEAHNIVSLSSLAQLMLGMEETEFDDIEVFKEKYKLK